MLGFIDERVRKLGINGSSGTLNEDVQRCILVRWLHSREFVRFINVKGGWVCGVVGLEGAHELKVFMRCGRSCKGRLDIPERGRRGLDGEKEDNGEGPIAS